MSRDRQIFATLVFTIIALWAMTTALYLVGRPPVVPGDVLSALRAYRHEEALSRAIVASILTTILVPLTWILATRSES